MTTYQKKIDGITDGKSNNTKYKLICKYNNGKYYFICRNEQMHYSTPSMSEMMEVTDRNSVI